MFPESLFAAVLEDALVATNNDKVHFSDTDQAHVLRMDVPGVKADRISIEETDGEIEITAVRMMGDEAKVYQQVFYLNPFRHDIDHAKATLTNGVLTLTIPKVEANTTIEVESAAIPTDLDTSSIFSHTLDLPGVPASSLQVQLVEDHVHLIGKRTLGDNKRVLVQTSFEVPPSMDTLQARALLQDGVFTFLAPVNESIDGQVRTIFVQEEDEEMLVESVAAVADLKIADVADVDNADGTSSTKEAETMEQDHGDMTVETVDEDAEAKDTDSWEEVRRSA